MIKVVANEALKEIVIAAHMAGQNENAIAGEGNYIREQKAIRYFNDTYSLNFEEIE